MTSFISAKDSVLETYTRPFEAAMIEESSLEDILVPVITLLNNEIAAAKLHLDSCNKEDEAVVQMTEMLKGADLVQTHFEFTLAMLETTSEEEMSALKEKYSSIRVGYESIKTKEDLTLVPARHVAATLHNSIVLELAGVFKRCFRKRWNGKSELVKNEENLAWITIMIDRIEFFNNHYPQALTLPKDDIFSQPKTSQVWQELYQSATFKKIITEAQVKAGFDPLIAKVHLLRILFKNFVHYKDMSYPRAAYSHIRDLIYYALQPAKAKAKALLHLVKPKVEEAIQPWRFADHFITCTYMSLGYPSIGHDDLIYIPRLFPAITKEVILNEYKENTLNKIQPMDKSKLILPELPADKSAMLEDLFVDKENKIPIRILAPEYIDMKGNQKGLVRRIWDNTVGRLRRGEPQPMQSQDKEQAIVINIHGGGFVALSSNTQKVYLNRWVNTLNLVHFSIDYRLAPENMYPDGLDDVWQSYLWIVNYAKTVLGIENQKIILTGDSAGGTLALALTLRLIRAGMQPPHGVVLVYPALNIDDNSATPSQFLALNDGMLPVSLVKLVANAYAGEEFKKDADPFLSPIHASDELLAKLPPMRMFVGSSDPLADDHWRMLAKLKKLEKDAKLIVHENLPHGYLGHQDCQDYDCFVQDASDAIEELLAL